MRSKWEHVGRKDSAVEIAEMKKADPRRFEMANALRVLALDGDRDHKLLEGKALSVQIRRDGPWVIDIEAAMRWAVAEGMIARS